MIRRMYVATLLVSTLVGAGSALAAGDPPPSPLPATPTTQTAPAVTKSRLDPKEVICKRQDVTGSRLGGTKTCHTRQEWNDMAAASREQTDGLQQKSNTGVIH